MREYLDKMGLSPINSGIYDKIAYWVSWYRGKSKDFHYYKQYNGKKYIKRERASLGMAKHVCEDWANLLLNEKVEITASDDASTKLIRQVLFDNKFHVLGNRLVELAFALGTGAFVEYLENGKVRIDYISADKIFPLSFSNGEITECAFCSEKVIGGKACVYIQAHVIENGKYIVKNRLFSKDENEELPLPEGMQADYYTGLSSCCLFFQVISPNIVNNAEIGSPFGISIFENAIDVLCGVDLVYDSYCNEFRLGKKRITVPVSMAQMQIEENGDKKPIFDDNDVEFFALNTLASTDDKSGIREIDMNLRSAEHKEGLQYQLNLLSERCGLGTRRYSFEAGGVKTATEVISEQSSMFQALKKHELILQSALIKLSKAVLFLSGSRATPEIQIDFDDSVIHDTTAEFTQNMQLVSSGIMSKTEFRMWWFNESKEQAEEMLAMNDEAVPEEEF